jgi:hypothetical protein
MRLRRAQEKPIALLVPSALRRVVRTHLSLFESQVATTLAGTIRAEQGGNLLALLFYGSHLNRTASPESDHDFFLIMEDYGRAHSNRLHAWACGILPPSIYRRRVWIPDGSEHACKVSILSAADLARATGPDAPDSYILGRLGKRVAIVWARDEPARHGVEDAVCRAAAMCGAWALRGMQAPFSADAFVLEALALSYRCEERLEGWERAKVLFAADEAYFRGVYGAFLAAAETAGLVRRLDRDGLLRVSGAREARHRERRMYARFLARSRRRARLRWLKNIWTFEGWVDYMISKIKRHHGIVIELSPRERRFPILAAIRYYFRLRKDKRLH